jgi:hypothetical protein
MDYNSMFAFQLRNGDIYGSDNYDRDRVFINVNASRNVEFVERRDIPDKIELEMGPTSPASAQGPIAPNNPGIFMPIAPGFPGSTMPRGLPSLAGSSIERRDIPDKIELEMDPTSPASAQGPIAPNNPGIFMPITPDFSESAMPRRSPSLAGSSLSDKIELKMDPTSPASAQGSIASNDPGIFMPIAPGFPGSAVPGGPPSLAGLSL